MNPGFNLRSSSRCRGGWIVFVSLSSLGAIEGAVAAAVYTWQAVSSLDALAETNNAPSRHDVEVYGRVRLPSDVGDLRARLQTWISKRTLLARFSIVPGDLADLLASGEFRGPSTVPVYVQLGVSGRPDWWTPEAARSYLMAEGVQGAILVDMDRPDRYVVYLMRCS